MVVISKAIIHEFGFIHHDSIEALNKWYDECKKSNWKNFAEIKKHLIQLTMLGMTDKCLI
jgi:mRNA-degrading endonuclease HigB of HigAB toxin-antitoxin module